MRAGTIVATNYLEMARLLAGSFLAAHPGDTFVILLVDDLPIDDSASGASTAGDRADDDSTGEASGLDRSGAQIVRLRDLPLDAAEIDMMKTIYDVMELSTAVKPAFLQLLLADDEIAAYLDPDIFVYAPFGQIIAELMAGPNEPSIVLTPHVLTPIPRDGRGPDERNIMQSGIFNLGFISVNRAGGEFLHWWQERLLVDAVSDVEANLFTDQRWIDWVPAIWNGAVCRDPGLNIAWWNIHERTLARDGDGAPTANGAPVRFVHFSGYDPSTPEVFSKHQHRPRTEHAVGLVIRELADAYGAELLSNGHEQRRRTPYEWTRTELGAELSPVVRATVRRAVLHGERTGTEAGPIATDVPMAFGPTADRFEAWLAEPVIAADGIEFTRLEASLWEQRADLRAAFPHLAEADAPRYRQWLDNEPGAAEALGARARCAEGASPASAPAPASTGEAARTAAARSARLARRVGGRAYRAGRRAAASAKSARASKAAQS